MRDAVWACDHEHVDGMTCGRKSHRSATRSTGAEPRRAVAPSKQMPNCGMKGVVSTFDVPELPESRRVSTLIRLRRHPVDDRHRACNRRRRLRTVSVAPSGAALTAEPAGAVQGDGRRRCDRAEARPSRHASREPSTCNDCEWREHRQREIPLLGSARPLAPESADVLV